MKKKQVKINRLIITSKKDIVPSLNDYIYKKGWKSINGNIYKFFCFYIKIEIINNKVILDIWEKEKLTGIVTSGHQLSFYHFFSFIQIRIWIKAISKEIKKIDPNCKIEQTYTMMESNKILLTSSIFIFALTILLLIVSIIIAAIVMFFK